MEWLLTVATAAALCMVFAASEIALRRGIPAEVTRRLSHVAGAGAAATFPLYLQLRDVLVLASAFTVFLTFTWIQHSLKSIHAVARPSLGAPLLPLGLGLAALAIWNHPGAFAFAALVLACADPAAATVGTWVTSPRWRTAGGMKSLSGTLAFFAVTLVLAAIFSSAAGVPFTVKIVAVAAILTIVEGSLGYGLDNLLLPLAAAILGATLLGL